ncbi:DUF1566 domain-containing protein [Leptospira yasudae]|nr:DUF1566 domain-containing protein [Leptospira yasudae]
MKINKFKIGLIVSVIVLFQSCLTEKPQGLVGLFFSILQDKPIQPDSTSSIPQTGPGGPPAASVHKIVIEPSTFTQEAGGTVQFRAYYYIDGVLNSEVTESVDWSSADTSVLTVSNTPGSKGLATKVAYGVSNVTISPISPLADTLPTTYTNEDATATVADLTSPTLISFSPPNGSSGFSPNSFRLRYVFSEPMDTSAAPIMSFDDKMGASSFAPFPGFSYSYLWDSSTVLSVYVYPLPENFTIRWNMISTAVTDAAGNPLNTNYSGTSGTTAEYFLTPLADTGQTQCWDASGALIACAGTGMDAAIIGASPTSSLSLPSVNPSYPNEPITYHGLTDLTWASCVNGQAWSGSNCTGTGSPNLYGALAATWQQAVHRCREYDKLNGGAGYAGLQNWRLPTIREMQSLFDYSYYADDYIISPIHFPNIIDGNTNYWSSSVRANSKDKAFKVNIYAGKTQSADKTTNLYYHYCVTSG